MKIILSNFNKVFESRVRLGIMSVLAVSNSMDFTGLKETLAVTDGNSPAISGPWRMRDL